MVNEKYAIAMAETLHYLKGINQNDIDKIPSKFMKFLKDNASQDYVCEFERKEEELSSLEDENRTISEALKDQQETGKDIGEE